MAKNIILSDYQDFHYYSDEESLITQSNSVAQSRQHSTCKHYSDYILTKQPNLYFNSFKCDNCKAFSNWEPNKQ